MTVEIFGGEGGEIKSVEWRVVLLSIGFSGGKFDHSATRLESFKIRSVVYWNKISAPIGVERVNSVGSIESL